MRQQSVRVTASYKRTHGPISVLLYDGHKGVFKLIYILPNDADYSLDACLGMCITLCVCDINTLYIGPVVQMLFHKNTSIVDGQ